MARINKARGATQDGVGVSDNRGGDAVLLRGKRILVLPDRVGFSLTDNATPTTWIAPDSVGINVDGLISFNGERGGNEWVHDWAATGAAGWTQQPITADGAQVFTAAASSSTGRLSVTAAASSAPNHRIAYLRQNTLWRDAEVRSIIYGPTTSWNGTNAQQGHLHRVRRLSATRWEAIAVWTTIVGGSDYGYLHANGVQWTGTTLFQATNADTFLGPFGYGDSAYIDHSLGVTARERTQPFFYNNNFRVARPELISVAAGNLIAITALADTTFNEASIAVNAVDLTNGIVTVIEPTTAATVAYAAVAAGLITPTGVDSQKRWCPFGLATRVVGGTTASVTIEAKRWRLDEPEPDWGDARVQRAATTPSSDVPTLAVNEGMHGLWAAHFNTSSGGAWGPVRFRRLD